MSASTDTSRTARRRPGRRALALVLAGVAVLGLGALAVTLLLPGVGADLAELVDGGDQRDGMRELAEEADEGGEVDPVPALDAAHGYFNEVLWAGAEHDQAELEDLAEPLAASLHDQGGDDERRAAHALEVAVEEAAEGELRQAHDRVERLEHVLRGVEPPEDSHPES